MDHNSDFPEDLQRVGATVSVLCVRATLIHTIRQILVAPRTTLGHRQRAGMLRVRQFKIVM